MRTAATFATLLWAFSAGACPNCVDAVARQDAAGSATAAWNGSILFMLSVPLGLATAFTIGLVRLGRQGPATQ